MVFRRLRESSKYVSQHSSTRGCSLEIEQMNTGKHWCLSSLPSKLKTRTVSPRKRKRTDTVVNDLSRHVEIGRFGKNNPKTVDLGRCRLRSIFWLFSAPFGRRTSIISPKRTVGRSLLSAVCSQQCTFQKLGDVECGIFVMLLTELTVRKCTDPVRFSNCQLNSLDHSSHFTTNR